MIKKVFLTLAALSVLGCAKNRDVERVRPGDRQNEILKESFIRPTSDDFQKEEFKKLGVNGEASVWLAKTTIVNTSDSPSGAGLFLGFQGDVKAGYFEFTEQKLLFRSVTGRYSGEENENIKNSVLLSWDIDHLDYVLDQKDGQTVNQEIEDNFKTYDQKKYFKIQWNANLKNEHQMMPSSSFAQFSCWEPASVRRVDNSMKIEPEHIGFKVEVVYQRIPACGNAQQWAEGDFNFTVTYKYSFMRMQPSDYKPKYYSGEQDPDRYEYGHFQTVRRVINPKNGREQNIFMENRWSEKTHYLYFVKGFPEKYKWIWNHKNPHSVLGQTNALFASAGSKLRFEIYDYDYNHDTGLNNGPQREFGDLRYSFINFIERLEAGGTPLGYGPSDTNPFTGEILAANTMVWTGFLEYYLELTDEVVKQAQEESSLFKKYRAALNIGETPVDALVTNNWDQNQKQSMGALFKQMAHETRYAYPYWNSYTQDSAGNLMIPTVAERPKKSGVDSLLDHDHSHSPFDISNLELVPADLTPFDFETRMLNGKLQAKVVNPLQTIDLSWMKRVLGNASFTPGGSYPGGSVQLLNLINNFGKLANKNYSGDASIDAIAEEFGRNQALNIQRNMEGHCIIDMNEYAGSLAGYLSASQLDLSDEKVRQDIINTVLYRVSIHEFGHNLNLRHNFYGSVDQENFGVGQAGSIANFAGSNGLAPMTVSGDQIVPVAPEQSALKKARTQVSSSVMDYLRLEDEINTAWAWEDYDVAALLDSYGPNGFDAKGRLYLFCTDEHTATSAICNRHDLGTTPSQILMSQIRTYDERYEMRNKRFGRAYWNTSGYASSVFGTMLSMKEFLAFWRTGLAEDMLNEKLFDMGITNLNDQKVFVEDMNREMRTVMKLTLGFYQAVIQQSRGDRDYRSEYDPVTGALKYIGIMPDKIYAMLFMAGDDTFLYNPNRFMNYMSYLTYSNDDGEMAEYTEQVWRNVVTDRNVAMEPWFVNFARMLYAKNAINHNNRSDASLINSIKIVKVDDAQLLFKQYGLKLAPEVPIEEVSLPKSTTSAFKKGDNVVVVHVDGSYYMSKVSEGDVTFTLFQEALNNLTGSGGDDASLTQFNMDVREFYWLYEAAKSEALQ